MVGAGRIRAVEAVEEVGELLRRDGVAGVFHLERGIAPALAERQAHGRARGRVLHGVVEQDGEHLPQLVRAAAHGEVLRQLILERVPRLEGDRLEGHGRLVRQLAQRDRLHRRFRAAAVAAGEGQHPLDKAAHTLRLGADVVEILGALGGALLLCEEVGRGEDDRQRRFQLVRRVGDKALLLVPRALHRAHGQSREQIAEPEEHRQRPQPQQQARTQQLAQGGLLAGAVGEGDARGERGLHAQIAQLIIPQDALVVRLVETVLNDGEQRLLVVEAVVAAAADADGAAVIDDGDEARAAPRRLSGRERVIGAGLQRLLEGEGALARKARARDEEHRREHRQQNRRHDGHVDADHLPAQAFDHPSTSRQ